MGIFSYDLSPISGQLPTVCYHTWKRLGNSQIPTLQILMKLKYKYELSYSNFIMIKGLYFLDYDAPCFFWFWKFFILSWTSLWIDCETFLPIQVSGMCGNWRQVSLNLTWPPIPELLGMSSDVLWSFSEREVHSGRMELLRTSQSLGGV